MSARQETSAFTVEFETIDPEMYTFDADLVMAEKNPILYAMKARNNPDIMYHHEAMRAHDSEDFRAAMKKELDDHARRKHWKLVKKKSVPNGLKLLPACWSMMRKRRIGTGEVYKHKSRLTVGGHKQEKGIHYEETYSPVVRWTSIRLILILTLFYGWKTRQLDFVLAYPQAKLSNSNTYLSLPKGFEMTDLALLDGAPTNKDANMQDYCLHVIQNVYGAKDGGRTWHLHLREALMTLGWTPLDSDECVYIKGSSIFATFVDDGIMVDAEDAVINQEMKLLESQFTIEDMGTLDEYLEVKITRNEGDSSFTMTQPKMIDSILRDLKLIDKDGKPLPGAKGADLPYVENKKLWKDPNDKPFDYDWDYRALVGKLNFLEKSTRGDLGYAVHQCARFVSCPTRQHGEAIKRIGRYLLSTRDKGYILKPTKELSFDCFVDADYCGNFESKAKELDPNMARSRAGYIIRFAGAPLVWRSSLMPAHYLSTCEAEYAALSLALRDVIEMMQMLTEFNAKGYKLPVKPTIRCKLFEDNSGALEIARVQKYRPRTRHLCASLHHFRSFVASGKINILSVGTKDQIADPLTKGCEKALYYKHRKTTYGW